MKKLSIVALSLLLTVGAFAQAGQAPATKAAPAEKATPANNAGEKHHKGHHGHHHGHKKDGAAAPAKKG
jgi:hypothetical protein